MGYENAYEQFRSLLGLQVKINLGGPESRVGRLLDVRSDYLALETNEDGVLYYQLRHIKSITKFSKNASRNFRRARYHKYDNFIDVLERLKFKWVKINRGGPQSIEGIISHIKDDNILLIVNDEILVIPIFHVQNINQMEKQSSKDGGGKNSGKRSNKDSDKGSGRRSNRGSGRGAGHRSNRGSGRRSDRRSNRSSDKGSGRRSNRSTGRQSRRSNQHHDGRDDVKDAYERAHEESITHFMFKDPEEDGRHSGTGTCSCGSRRSMHSHRSMSSRRSMRSHRSAGSSRRSMRSHRSTGSSRGSMRSHRSMSSGKSMRSDSSHSDTTQGVNDTKKVWFPKS